MSVTYLSDEWIDAADALLRKVSIEPPLVGPGFSIETVVTDGPHGDRRYTVEVEGATLRAHVAGAAHDSVVRLTQQHRTAVAIARGESSAQAAFLAADIQLGGDVSILIAHAGLVAQIGDALAPLRRTTDFGPNATVTR